MDIIEQHIKETQEIIAQNDYERAEQQYNMLFSLYKDKIAGYENGTTSLRSKTNAVWNLNDGINFPIDVDYIYDLKLILQKIIMYKQELDKKSPQNQTFYNNIQNTGTIKVKDGSINIGNTGVSESVSPRKKPSVWGIIGWIIAALSGVATIVTLILQVCGVI